MFPRKETDPIIPHNAAFFWKWSIPGLRTFLIRKRFDKLFIFETTNNADAIKKQHLKLSRSISSCIYGKQISPSFKRLCTELEYDTILQISEIRPLVYSRFLKEDESKNVTLKTSRLLLLGDVFMATVISILIAIFTFAFAISPATTLYNTLVYSALILFYIVSLVFIFWYGIKPYFTCKSKRTAINKLISHHNMRSKIKTVK